MTARNLNLEEYGAPVDVTALPAPPRHLTDKDSAGSVGRESGSVPAARAAPGGRGLSGRAAARQIVVTPIEQPRAMSAAPEVAGVSESTVTLSWEQVPPK